MGTINSKAIVDKIIAGNGHYAGDPRVVKIVEYNNMFDGAVCYGLISKGQRLDLYDDVLRAPGTKPRVVWEAK